ncbi:MAG: NAD(P)H-dependent oxidoreductase [Xanthomonadaceae bacterium]|nr:NAD(P)H-dependent oxidoreductase [Xanthomonadaceae bacterium]
MTELNERQKALCDSSPYDFSGLRAAFINCTLKRTPQKSHTEGLMAVSRKIMDLNGIATTLVRAVDHDIASGVYPDMTEHGWERDAWPEIYEKVRSAHIIVIGTPIWLGDKSSICAKVIERLYAHSGDLNDGLRRPGERFHEPQYHIHDLEPDASGVDAASGRWHPGARQPALAVGRGLPLRLREPRA